MLSIGIGLIYGPIIPNKAIGKMAAITVKVANIVVSYFILWQIAACLKGNLFHFEMPMHIFGNNNNIINNNTYKTKSKKCNSV